MTDEPDEPVEVPAADLAELVTAIFVAEGFGSADAREIAESLVDAELRGNHSHGVMLVPMYLARLRAGGVTRRRRAEIVHDAGGLVILDAGHAMGQLTSAQAVDLAAERAHRHGVAAVAVRHAHHFGAAGRWAARAVRHGCIGVAMSNTRPMMPAPGGSVPVVGNNPVAIAVPVAGDVPFELDMALSAAALGKIRLAAAEDRPIPPDWAADAGGVPTTNAGAAIAGMLLPAGGTKGFGLALMIDVLTGVLSGGGWGDRVRPLYLEPDRPNDCAHLFLAIRPDEGFAARAAERAAAVRRSPPLAGDAATIQTPGEGKWRTLVSGRRAGLTVAAGTFRDLRAAAAELGIDRVPARPPTDDDKES